MSARIFLVLSILLTACSDVPSSPIPANGPTPRRTVAALQAATGEDLLAFSETDASFAGMYLDNNGDVVYTRVDDGQAEVSSNSRAEKLAERGFGNRIVRTGTATYRFADLVAWKETAASLIRQPFVVGLDADEVANRLRIDVTNIHGVPAVRAALERAGVPSNAIVFALVEEPQLTQSSLWGKFRPMVGGIFIENTKTLEFCSIGVIATRDGVRGFITAAHCSYTWGKLERDMFRQPDGIIVGAESVDPPFSGCWDLFTCRSSDAMFVVINSGTSTLGSIAHPIQVGSATVSPSTPRFTITSESSYGAVVGMTMDKVGVTTGWTRGKVSGTCKTRYLSQRSTQTFTCMDEVKASTGAMSDHGDSGGPVFVTLSSTSVSIYGIVSYSSSSNTILGYSRMPMVRSELGGTIAVR